MNSLARCKLCNVVQWVDPAVIAARFSPADGSMGKSPDDPMSFEYLCPVCQRTTFFALVECGGSPPLSSGGAA